MATPAIATVAEAAAGAEPDAHTLRRKLSFSDGDELPTTTLSGPERLRVFVRVRPLATSNGGATTEPSSEMLVTDTAVSLRTVKSTAQGRDSVEEASYSFDAVFDTDATQAQVFETAMLPQVRSLFAGRDTLTFAYGITNAGKTHTIQGDLASSAQMGGKFIDDRPATQLGAEHGPHPRDLRA